MAKKGVVMYYDLLEQLQDFTDEQFGKITRAMIKYDKDGIEPQFNDIQIRLAFNILKPTIDRNKQEYKEKCDKNRENINKRWKKQDTNEYDCIRMNTNYTDIDIDKDIDIDIEKDINKKEIYKEKVEQSPTHTQSFKEENKTKEEKHKYGEFGWVKLTDTEYKRLASEFSNIDEIIDGVDKYVQITQNKNKYKDWNLVIRKAIREQWSCIKSSQKTFKRNYSEKEFDGLIQSVEEIEI